MVEVKEHVELDQALVLIDEALGDLADRSLISASEVSDLLLDLRLLLVTADEPLLAP